VVRIDGAFVIADQRAAWSCATENSFGECRAGMLKPASTSRNFHEFSGAAWPCRTPASSMRRREVPV